ncbi:MAG: preprotein translocase subunit YajC [Oscillospiraceae bacterium]|nr:preprotein translocase subunit YajC [Oscillospiraceae bacterium]
MQGASSILMIVAMLAIFYFLMIVPENKRKKKAEEMRNSLKKGERITTIGGLTGKIVQVNDSTVVFETSEDRVRIEIQKWGIQSTESSEQAAAAQQSMGLFGKKKAEEAPAETEKQDSAPKNEEKKDFDPEIK